MPKIIYIIIYILAVLLGFNIGLKLNQVNIYHGPNSNNIKKKIYKSKDGRCYKLIPIVHICPISLSMKK